MTIGPTSPAMLSLPDPGRPRQGPDMADVERAREAARDLEALLVTQLISAMRRTVPESEMLQSSASRRTLDDAFDHELARALVADGSLGFAKQIEAQILARGHGAGGPTPVPSPAEAFAPSRPAASVPRELETRGTVPTNSNPVVTRVERPATARAVSLSVGGVFPEAYRAGAVSSPRPPLDEPRITSVFGMRVDPLTGDDRFHGGIDLGAPQGTPIRAAVDGEVVFSGRRGAAGNVVEVRHADGLLTSYAHAERTLVGVGQKVVAGDVIATVGSTGRSTGPHLHFSVRRDGQVVDPAALIPELGRVGRIG